MRTIIESINASAKSAGGDVAVKMIEGMVAGAASLARCLEATMAMDIIGVVTHTTPSCISLIVVDRGEYYDSPY